ncbi:MAG TPA: hypothetical protein VFT04_09085 [Gemmatimonadales bacterium]|nr:hypothetical protein [Gemmatimonadales bacterium]
MHRWTAVCLLALCSGAPAPLAGQAASLAVANEPTLDEVRQLTRRYLSADSALADGYVRDPSNTCESSELMGLPAEVGVMGIHFFRPDLLGITGPPNPKVNGTGTHTDFRKPAVLIYEPQADGSLQLVAVENLVFIESWEAAGHTAPPVFQGHVYNRMVDDPATPVDEAHHFESHYDLHVWLYKENPAGMFAQFNPAGTCKHHQNKAHAH